MKDEPLIKLFAFFAFYMQLLSLVYLYSFWGWVGIDPTGYISLQNVLIESGYFSLSVLFLFSVYVFISFYDTRFHTLILSGRDNDNNKLRFFLGSLVAVAWLTILTFMAYNLPLEWESTFNTAYACIGIIIFDVVDMVFHGSKINYIFSKKRHAHACLAIVLAGFFTCVPKAVWDARKSYYGTSEQPFVYTEGAIKSAGRLIGVLGDNYIVKDSSNGNIIAILPSRISYLEYPKAESND